MTHDLTDAAVALARILAEENRALAALDLRRAAAMLPAKSSAADQLVIACRAAFEVDLPAMRHLAAVAADNRRLLQRAITVQGHVMEMVARALRRASPGGPSRYGAQGRTIATPAQALAMIARA